MDRCIIFFSGNGIFFPDTIEEFKKTIEIRNRYEWEQISKNVNAKKLIFMRDLKKNWYQKGINIKINNINKIVLFLKKETKKFPEIVLIGSSAGGYLASVIGNYIKRAYVINFAGQVDLTYEGLVLKNKKYQNISRKMKNSEIFYFFSNKNKNDLIHYNLIKKNNNIKFFKFDSNVHGPAVNYLVLKKIINMSLFELKQLSKKNKSLINPIRFSFSLINPFNLMFFMIFKIIRKYIYG